MILKPAAAVKIAGVSPTRPRSIAPAVRAWSTGGPEVNWLHSIR
ncbi:hypothetical protein FrEUN1fDRAFT_6428 [Parafrankia sp. EUN1f]|nr:hypothetical protein FrEUN1fDRAFT_6428 [Parafrankia sp. EUN1f]